jgi:hypothetical protein
MWSRHFRPDKSASPAEWRGFDRGTLHAACGLLPCPARWHGATFFEPQTELSYPQPDHRPTHRHTALECEPFAQLGYRHIGVRLNQSRDPSRYFRSQTALGSGPITHPFSPPTRLPLAKDLLHITQADAEYCRQFPEAAMPLCMRLEYLATQIILVGSRHLVFVAESRLFHITPSVLSL